jgi:hypothetical protein
LAFSPQALLLKIRQLASGDFHAHHDDRVFAG